MPHYFFDTFNCNTWNNDDEGLDREHDGAARIAAQGGLADLAYEEVHDGTQGMIILRVRDEDGPLMEAHLDVHTIWLR